MAENESFDQKSGHSVEDSIDSDDSSDVSEKEGYETLSSSQSELLNSTFDKSLTRNIPKSTPLKQSSNDNKLARSLSADSTESEELNSANTKFMMRERMPKFLQLPNTSNIPEANVSKINYNNNSSNGEASSNEDMDSLRLGTTAEVEEKTKTLPDLVKSPKPQIGEGLLERDDNDSNNLSKKKPTDKGGKGKELVNKAPTENQEKDAEIRTMNRSLSVQDLKAENSRNNLEQGKSPVIEALDLEVSQVVPKGRGRNKKTVALKLDPQLKTKPVAKTVGKGKTKTNVTDTSTPVVENSGQMDKTEEMEMTKEVKEVKKRGRKKNPEPAAKTEVPEVKTAAQTTDKIAKRQNKRVKKGSVVDVANNENTEISTVKETPKKDTKGKRKAANVDGPSSKQTKIEQDKEPEIEEPVVKLKATRGRNPKAKKELQVVVEKSKTGIEDSTLLTKSVAEVKNVKTTRKRGAIMEDTHSSPKKARKAAPEKNIVEEPPKPKIPRGRKKKTDLDEQKASISGINSAKEEPPPKASRGRSKAVKEAVTEEVPKKQATRGRKKTVVEETKVAEVPKRPSKVKKNVEQVEIEATKPKVVKAKGKPAKNSLTKEPPEKPQQVENDDVKEASTSKKPVTKQKATNKKTEKTIVETEVRTSKRNRK